MRPRRPAGNLGGVQRWALVVRRTERARRYRWWVVVPFAVFIAVFTAVAVRVVASDPVGYGVPFWPFADGPDRVERQVMDGVASAARTQDDPGGVPSAVAGGGVEVLETHVRAAAGVWMRLRLHLGDVVRCREVMVSGDGAQVTSRRVEC